MRNIQTLLQGIFFALLLLNSPVDSFANNDGDDDDKKKQQKTDQTAKKVLKEGIDDLLFNPDRFCPTYDESPDITGENCDMKVRFKLKMKGKTVQFKNTSESTYTHVEWRFGDGILSHDTNITQHTYEKGGLYYFSVMVYNAYTGCMDTFLGSYFIFDPHQQMGNVKPQKSIKQAAKYSLKNKILVKKEALLEKVLADMYVEEADTAVLLEEEFE